jgi:hypothetical protein
MSESRCGGRCRIHPPCVCEREGVSAVWRPGIVVYTPPHAFASARGCRSRIVAGVVVYTLHAWWASQTARIREKTRILQTRRKPRESRRAQVLALTCKRSGPCALPFHPKPSQLPTSRYPHVPYQRWPTCKVPQSAMRRHALPESKTAALTWSRRRTVYYRPIGL